MILVIYIKKNGGKDEQINKKGRILERHQKCASIFSKMLE